MSVQQVFPPDNENHNQSTNMGSLTSICSASGTSDLCRICHEEATVDAPLISPCSCTGSLGFVHQKCLQRWVNTSQTKTCELCTYEFQMHSTVKPFSKWEKLDVSRMERRTILWSVTCHVLAITCVIGSLYVLIDRTMQEAKLIVAAMGCAGGLVLMFVLNCKRYVSLFRQWKIHNRVIFIQACERDPPPQNVVMVSMGPPVSETFPTPATFRDPTSSSPPDGGRASHT